ncbi:uncharacterized protein N7443_007037 [Penicillium atrosanguineum]|uniref:uncharacterized protein n=1 Tax=Penicillium atrosanguineum TaxID=1132637 RepID=UPI002395A0D4|nr:uncharacterized protein N7443_007037 [Penicillium atrosanguineum]KAJ5298917.1 hypothetical protein N7443_007037 [Penicillium atrosanguineum]
MIRLFNRFYALCAVAACTILFSAWALTSRAYGDITPIKSGNFQTVTEFDQRLVVFGDSWSDNETEELQGKAWTDWLCGMFNCHQENLAQTSKSVLNGEYTGAVVDNQELDLVDRLSKTHLPDFKTQLKQWLDAESPTLKGLSEEQIQFRQEHTIFVISFGIWDIWDLVTKDEDYNNAAGSIERRIKTLLEQMEQLSEHWGSTDLNVILTQVVDVTFLPGFKDQGDQYKNAVKLIGEWNRALRDAARQWERGRIYLFDTNSFVLDRIRDWQLYAAGIEEENGLGKNQEGWVNMVDPCVESGKGIKVMMSSSSGKICSNPEKYLFWNEMQLGPAAQRLMATEIYRGIDEGEFERHTRNFAA